MTYSKAPIREAVLDIRVTGLENQSFEDFHSLFEKEKIASEYPNKRQINSLQGSFTIKSDNTRTEEEVKSNFYGLIFSSEKNNRQVQFRKDGYTYNFLAPYSNWDEFKGESRLLWDMFIEKFPNLKVERMALRYINRIVLPRPFINVEEFVINVPPIPKGLPQIFNSFFSSIEVPCEREDYIAIINTTIETPTPKEVPFILDIDVFKEVKNNFDFDDFDYIREVKNSIFESCITDKARTLFN